MLLVQKHISFAENQEQGRLLAKLVKASICKVKDALLGELVKASICNGSL